MTAVDDDVVVDEYRAAIRSHGSWLLTNDAELVYNTPDEDVMFIHTEEELKQVLLDQLPKTAYEHLENRIIEPNSWDSKKLFSAHIAYIGDDPEELATILRETPEVNKLGVHLAQFGYYSNFRYDALLLLGLLHNGYTVTYNPELTKRIIRRKKANELKVGMRMVDLCLCNNMLYSTIRNIFCYESRYTASSWYSTSMQFADHLRIFGILFGKNAYRRHKGVQDLLEKWRTITAAGKNRLRNFSDLLGFCAWLDREVDKPKLPLRTEWTVKRNEAPFTVEGLAPSPEQPARKAVAS